MRVNKISIIIFLIVNLFLYAYHWALESKIQSEVTFYENYAKSILNGETDIDDFQCLLNIKSLPSIFSIYIQEYQMIKSDFEYFLENAKMGRIVESRLTFEGYLPHIPCLKTSKRVYDYKINKRLTGQFYNNKSYMLGASAADYLTQYRIDIIQDESNGFCNIALNRSIPIEYIFNCTLNGKPLDYYKNNSINNSSIEDGKINVTIIDPCNKSNNKDFSLKI